MLPLGVARAIGAAAGACWWRLDTREARVARVNIDAAFPQLSSQKRSELARQSMRQWGISLFEVPVVWGGSREWLAEKIVSETDDAAWQQIRKGEDDAEATGMIVLAPHLGNWEVVGLHCSVKANGITSMYAPSGQGAVDDLIKNARQRFGGTLVPTDKKGVMALIKALRAGEVVGVLPDQVPPEAGGCFSPFFGIPALTMTLIHNLLKRSGAKAVFVYAKRVPGGFDMVYQAPPEEIYSEDQQTSVDALNRGVEACVKGAIEQYQWEYKRYKKLPEGYAKIYTRENTS